MLLLLRFLIKPNELYRVKSQLQIQIDRIQLKIEEMKYGQAQTLFYKFDKDYPSQVNYKIHDFVTQEIIIKRLRHQIYQQLARILPCRTQSSILSKLKQRDLQQAKELSLKSQLPQIKDIIIQLQHYRALKRQFTSLNNKFQRDYTQDQYFQKIIHLVNSNIQVMKTINNDYSKMMKKQMKGDMIVLDQQFQKMTFRLEGVQKQIFLAKCHNQKYQQKYQQFVSFCMELMNKVDINIQKDEEFKYIQRMKKELSFWYDIHKEQLSRKEKALQESIIIGQYQKSILSIYNSVYNCKSQIQVQDISQSQQNFKRKLNQTKESLNSLLSSIINVRSRISHISTIRPNQTLPFQQETRQLQEELQKNRRIHEIDDLKRYIGQIQEIMNGKEIIICELNDRLQFKEQMMKQKLQRLNLSSSSDLQYIIPQPEPQLFQDSLILGSNSHSKSKLTKILKENIYNPIKQSTLVYFYQPTTISSIFNFYLTNNSHNLLYLIQMQNKNILIIYIMANIRDNSLDENESIYMQIHRQRKKIQSEIKVNNDYNFMMNMCCEQSSFKQFERDAKVTLDQRGLVFGNSELVINFDKAGLSSSITSKLQGLFKRGKVSQIAFNKLQIFKLNN